MSVDAWVTIAVLLGVVIVLVKDWVPPAPAVLGGVAVLVLAGVLTPQEGFSGFAAPATIAIGALFIVAGAVRQTGLLDAAVRRVLGPGGNERRTLARLTVPTASLSAIVANTPIVATLAGPLRTWAERHGRPPSRYLMPLSFAAIIGGTVTTIGTSPTLLVSGLLDATPDQTGFTVFEVTPVGLPAAIVGCITLIVLAPRLLPDRSDPVEQVAAQEREYTFQMFVQPGGPIDGATVREADLRDLGEVFLARVDRDGREIRPVAPDEHLYGGDILTFVGRVNRVRDITGRSGLTSLAEEHVDLLPSDRHGFFEAIVSPSSPMVGRTPKGAAFRGRYDAAIVAVHRAGERLGGKIGDIELKAGDALLLMGDAELAERWHERRDFLVVVPLDETPVQFDRSAVIALAVLVGMVAIAASGLVSIVNAALGAVLVLVLTRTLSLDEARDALDLEILFLVAGSFGLGAAVSASGLAALIAESIASVAGATGGLVALALILVATAGLTELVTNAASAGLMVPIALQVADRVGADPRGFAVAVALAASASFLTPIGYQTNTIVYGLGGYRYGDYWRLGLPLNLVMFGVALVMIPLVWTV